MYNAAGYERFHSGDYDFGFEWRDSYSKSKLEIPISRYVMYSRLIEVLDLNNLKTLRYTRCPQRMWIKLIAVEQATFSLFNLFNKCS